MKRQWLYIMFVSLMMACSSGTGPQRPSQRFGQSPEPDSAQMALMEFNQQMAVLADRELQLLVQEQSDTYALYDAQTWMHIFDRGDELQPAVRRNDQRLVRIVVHSLDGQLLSDEQLTVTLGKYILPMAVEANIDELHPGGHARLYAPWYTAYGMHGNAYVQPYQNVIIDVYIP